MSEGKDDDSYTINISEKPAKRATKKATFKKEQVHKAPPPKVQKAKKAKAEGTKSSSKFMDSYLQEMENSKRQHQLLSSSRRQKLTGESILNKAVEQIIVKVLSKDPNNFFRYPVDKKLALGYYQTIKEPICLEEMN